MDCRCCARKVLSVESESLIRKREAVSFPILKCDVHWAISFGVLIWCCECQDG